MKKSTSWLLALCILAVAGVFLLQFFWIRNYYYVNQATFEKEVNLAFDDALKKEFQVRCDTVEHNIYNFLLDTNEIEIIGKYSKKQKVLIYSLLEKKTHKISSMFHSDSLTDEINSKSPLIKRQKAAAYIAHGIRTNDLVDHVVLYYTQSLGKYIVTQNKKYDFDTTRLRPIFNRLLKEREIVIPYNFYLRNSDSIYNHTNFSPNILENYPVVTKAYSTYKQDRDQHYIRALFKSPFSYIINKMGLLFIGSLFLILIIALSLFYLLRSLLTEQKLSLLKNDFISNITHELKTPIATVSAAVESLADFDVLDDPQRTKRYLQHSKNELKRLSALVDTVLNSSLYESQQFDFNPQNLEVDQLMDHIIENYKLDRGKPVAISYSNSTGINTIYADGSLFQRVVGNIIDNAIKYSGDEVTIQIACSKQHSFFVVSITDNGIGIAKDNLPYLFEKFYRVPAKTHAVKGHGLGLNYVKSIMERHNGWCKVESELGKGTKISVAWPT